jgi:hypothetical protein
VGLAYLLQPAQIVGGCVHLPFVLFFCSQDLANLPPVIAEKNKKNKKKEKARVPGSKENGCCWGLEA